MNNNLLVIAPEYFSFVKDQTESVATNFHNVNVMVRYNPFAEISGYLPLDGLKGFRKSNRININNLPENINIYPTPIKYLPFDTSYKKLGNKHYVAVSKLIRKEKIDTTNSIIHAHHTWTAGYVAARLKEESKMPFVVTAHGYDIYSLPFKDDRWNKNIQYVLNSADHIITVSKRNMGCIKQLNDSTPVTIIPNGFSKKKFFPRNQSECRKLLNLPINKKIILAIGNLTEVKGHKHLIDAINIVKNAKADTLCLIIGSGGEKKSLQKRINGLGLHSHVLLIGGKPHDEIPLWINACDLFVLPSLDEGNPTVMFEALGCGKPFIGTRVGGVPEVITSDEYGLLAEPANPEDLAEKIMIALDREWEQKKIFDLATQYTWKNIAIQIMGVYERVLKETPLGKARL